MKEAELARALVYWRHASRLRGFADTTAVPGLAFRFRDAAVKCERLAERLGLHPDAAMADREAGRRPPSDPPQLDVQHLNAY